MRISHTIHDLDALICNHAFQAPIKCKVSVFVIKDAAFAIRENKKESRNRFLCFILYENSFLN